MLFAEPKMIDILWQIFNLILLIGRTLLIILVIVFLLKQIKSAWINPIRINRYNKCKYFRC